MPSLRSPSLGEADGNICQSMVCKAKERDDSGREQSSNTAGGGELTSHKGWGKGRGPAADIFTKQISVGQS